MHLIDALKHSSVKAAYVPYYKISRGLRNKQIVYSILKSGTADVYLVWEDTKNFICTLSDADDYKIRGRNDWKPVAPLYATFW